MEKRWYVVHTYSGYENKVKENLEKRIESTNMQDFVFRVLVPSIDEVVQKNGKTKIVTKKLYPGYVMVEMVKTDQSWFVVRNTPQVTGFLGSTSKGTAPTPLSQEEVDTIFNIMGIEELESIDFEVNEHVKINGGTFKDFVGRIDEILLDKKKIKLSINMFGRETPIELDFKSIEKIN
jgi:transcriptional antiterminator NusG